MKRTTDKNILIAFLLNISFSIIEFFGGLFTKSISILSDAIHDFADAISIGISYFLEKKSKHKPDNKYTYGYIRYSILGALITTLILTVGSILVIIGAVNRLFNPVTLNYDGMIIISIFGIIFNFLAAYMTKEGDSLNQKSVNLHMLEDVLGWIVVFVGSILIKFTNISYIDSIMSILIACYILFHALTNLKAVLDLFLEKTPKGIDIEHLKKHLLDIDGVLDVHHIHIWSIDGVNSYATLHIVTDSKNPNIIKMKVREELLEHNIVHTTIEIETSKEKCDENECHVKLNSTSHHHH